jgi:hypothetical protein
MIAPSGAACNQATTARRWFHSIRWDIISSALRGIGERGSGLTDIEKKRRQRSQAALDPERPALVIVDEWVGPIPAIGTPARLHLTTESRPKAALSGTPVTRLGRPTCSGRLVTEPAP